MANDETDKHPFYSDWALRQFEKRKRELIREEEETSKINARKARSKTPAEALETNTPGISGEQVRMVRGNQVPELPSHNREKIQAFSDRRPQRNGAMRKMPQVRHRNVRSPKPNSGRNVAVPKPARVSKIPSK